MSKLVPPHGSPELKPLLLEGQALADEIKRAASMKKVPLTSRETGDLIMMGIGGFTPLDGFMGYDDWKGICDEYKMPSKNGLFWPSPSPSRPPRSWQTPSPLARRWPCGTPRPTP